MLFKSSYGFIDLVTTKQSPSLIKEDETCRFCVKIAGRKTSETHFPPSLDRCNYFYSVAVDSHITSQKIPSRVTSWTGLMGYYSYH